MAYSAEEIKAISRDFVDSLDRSTLGSFIVNDEALYTADIEARVGLFTDLEHTITEDDYNLLETNFHGEDWISTANLALAARTEICFWWLRHGNWYMQDYIDHRRVDVTSKPIYDKLVIVSNNPEYHDYFAAGIWDIPLIVKLVSEGIDANLAVDLVA